MYATGDDQYGGMEQPRRRSFLSPTLIIALVLAAISFFKYCMHSEVNPLTGEKQFISMTKEQEVQLGLHSAPQMAQEFGGLSQDAQASALVKQIGQKVVESSSAKGQGYTFDFHLLADQQTVNAFALPGGQVFITEGLLGRLQTEDQLAGVLGHEVGHVVARHSADRMAKEELTQGLTSAAVVATGDYNTAQMAQVIGNMINMKYGREQELQSDDLGVRFMMESGYKPEELIGVMEILKQATGGQRQPEFSSTHPDPENRKEQIKAAIEKYRNQQQ
jgi:predicted Zn-dependent protease